MKKQRARAKLIECECLGPSSRSPLLALVHFVAKFESKPEPIELVLAQDHYGYHSQVYGSVIDSIEKNESGHFVASWHCLGSTRLGGG